MKFFIKKKKEGGYAILFTIIVVSIITMISMGLANTALKQIILSGVARDSTTAFYEADLGSECALYADDHFGMTNLPLTAGNIWTCAGHNSIISKVISSTYTSDDTTTYTLTPQTVDNNKCFRATVKKIDRDDYVETIIQVRGYNICDTSNIRTVERMLEIKY